MAGLRDIKRRIKSIGSTRKITRAMQMVSTAKMRKAQAAVVASRAYANLAWQLIGKLSVAERQSIPLLSEYPQARKVAVLLLSTNRGLVGSLNTNLLARARQIEREHEGLAVEYITYGKKGARTLSKLSESVIADFEKEDRTLEADRDVYPIARFLTTLYASAEYRKVFILYNHFYSTLVQKATATQLLPVVEQKREEGAGSSETEYLFEPDAKHILLHLLPRIVESQVYQHILESNASEHSARMLMMKNATDAASDLISDLTLTFNRLRQNKITTELSEITAGRTALRKR